MPDLKNCTRCCICSQNLADEAILSSLPEPQRNYLQLQVVSCASCGEHIWNLVSKLTGSTEEMDVVGGEECSGVQEEAAAAQQSFSWAPSVSTDPVWALLQQAIKLKAEGKAFYQDKKIRSSISRYHHALLIIRSLDADVMTYVKQFGPERPALTPEQYELLRNTQVDCYNNLAACLLQKKDVDYARVRDYSLRVLQWRPGDVKALYRAGVATLELGDAETAKKHLTQACREHPNDANVKKHLQRAEEKLSQELEKEKAMYKGMFSSTVKSTSGED